MKIASLVIIFYSTKSVIHNYGYSSILRVYTRISYGSPKLSMWNLSKLYTVIESVGKGKSVAK